jgi:hypothetical protein
VTVDLPMPPFCVANATKISLLIVLLVLIIDELVGCSYAEWQVCIPASSHPRLTGSSRIRFNGETGIRITGERRHCVMKSLNP